MDYAEDETRDNRYRKYLRTELEAAAMYAALADIEDDTRRAEVFRKLVNAEIRHASRWAEKLKVTPSSLELSDLSWKARLMHRAARVFGTEKVVTLLVREEARGLRTYFSDPEAKDLVPEERRHAQILKALTGSGGTPSDSPWPGYAPVMGASGTLRAAVLGGNDGLISNFCLVMGVAGGTTNADFVMLAGIAGLLAGAFSMAAGEYISMRSQRDISEHALRREAMELHDWPDEELEELELIFQAKGLTLEESRRVAQRLMAQPKVALDTMAREELGINPSELGSPWRATLSSFVAFVVGAVVPIAPYLLDVGGPAFTLSAVFSAGALVFVGGLLAIMSGNRPFWGALRMLLAGGAAAAVTFGAGRLVGVSIESLG